MFSSCNVARLRTISRTKATRITTIVCMLRTVAGSGLKCQDFRSRRGFEERQLLVIPSRAIGHIVSRELQACGYRVITALTPSIAFDMVVKMRPDMIITSAVLNPVSGIDLVRAFTAMTLSKHIPIAVLTSFAHNHQDILRLPAGTAIIRLDEHLKDDLANVIVDFEQRLTETTAAVAGGS